MLEELLQFDKELFLFLNHLGSTTWDAFWLFMTNKWSAIPLYLLLAYLALVKLGLKRTLFLLVAIALLIATTDQLANFFKYGVQRLRPCHDPDLNGLVRLVKASCGGEFGYFSAHAANASAVAFFFIHLLGKQNRYLGAFLFVWALTVAYSRIYLGVHYPLDVLTGIVLGALLGWLFARLFEKAAELERWKKKSSSH